MQRFLVCLSLVASVVAIALFANAAPSGANAADTVPPTVAFLDLESVFDQSIEKQRVEKELTDFIDETRAELEALGQEIDSLKRKTGLLNKSSPEYSKNMEEVIQKNARLQMKEKGAEETVATQWTTFREKHIADIRAASEQVAAARGIDLLLQKKLPKQDGVPDWDIVFFASPGLDVTDQVLSVINGSK